jgi:carbonic anhydrase
MPVGFFLSSPSRVCICFRQVLPRSQRLVISMSLLSEILDHNRTFVERKEYVPFLTDRFPNKKLVILTCMDTRLVELLPRAMNVHNGDVKIIKNAGAIVSHPFGSVMRSILVAVYQLGAAEVAVIGHHGCGMAGLSCEPVLEKMRDRGVPAEVLNTLSHSGIDLKHWLTGFHDVQTGVRESVAMVKNHPLLPKEVPVHGMVIHPETGHLELLVDGYQAV